MTSTTVTETRPDVRLGKRLGRYRLDSVIGVGAFSTVYRAYDTALDLPVVVKVLAQNASPAAVERFRREIVFSRRVAHPGFCRIFELHEDETFDGPLRYLTMEPIEGRTLGDVMNEGPMTPLRALSLVRALCEIVAAGHDQGVVHGDLKPGNVMVRPHAPERGRRVDRREHREDVVVLDFGAASASDMADPGVRVGSLRYMAPELFEDGRPSPQSDVWAIGVILYGCLTGRYPFDGENERAIAEASRRGPPPPPSSVREELRIVDDVVLRALARDRAVRFADCRAFAAALDEVLPHVRPARSLWDRLLALVKPL